MSNITQEMLKKETEKAFNRSMGAFIELSHDDGFVNTMEKYNVTLIELSSSMISQLFEVSNIGLKQDKEIFNTVDNFINMLSKQAGLHPTDTCLLAAKIISDMMMQISSVIRLEDNNNN